MIGGPRTKAVALAAVAAAIAPSPPVDAQPNVSAPAPSLHVLMINGGGSPEENFSSHLAHLRQLHGLLTGAGVPAERITVFNADGPDAGADMCVHVPEPEGYAFLAGTELGRALGRSVAFESSALPGVRAQPATLAALTRWFMEARGRMRPGDTLLLYVTDHGTENPRDPLDNRIVLWGRNESLSVRQLRALLDRLDPRVKVVNLMSQCFSGGFAHLAVSAGKTETVPAGNVCGYFASTADRPAYGCYPTVAGREGVGHSFEFMEALARTGRFADAHTAVLASDTTPDVPLRTSDVYAQRLIERAAQAASPAVEPEALVDRLLREAWKQRAQWEPELRLLDAIGRTFGLASARSLAELEQSRQRIGALARQLETYGAEWEEIRNNASLGNERRLRAARPEWKTRTAPGTLRALTEAGRRSLAANAAAALAAQARAEGRAERFTTVAARAGVADEASYRMEVREAALLRMRTVLVGIAGRVHLATAATPAERAAHEGLRRCEDLSLPRPRVEAAPGPRPTFPPLDDEQRVVQQVIPGWMGIMFDDRPSPRRERLKLGEGAAMVTRVLADSPALAAGLQVGDVVLGPPGQPFSQQGDIKAWTMMLPVDKPQPIEVLRDAKRLSLSLVPRPRPVELPQLGPPKLATPAPPVHGSIYRGQALDKLTARGPFLLVFWATWCAPCKESLPEAMAYARARRLPIIAVTDEGRAELDAFFKKWKAPFPANVVSDEDRLTFAAYGVSGTPTFIVVDDQRLVGALAVGYNRARGLPIPGWQWDGK